MNNRDSHLAGLFWLLLLAQTLAVGKNTPWGALPVELGRILWVGASAFVLLLFFLKRLPSPNGFRSRAALITWTTLNFAYLGMSAFRFAPMGYEFPQLTLVGTGALFLLLLVPAVYQKPEHLFAVACGFNLVILIGSILHFPVNPLRSDMLPVIQKGLDLWGDGASPYSIFELAGRTNRMGYLPGTLFMNWPAWALGLDLRWNTVLYRIAWMLLIGAHLRRTRSLNSPAGLAFVWLFLSPYINFRHELYFEGFILGLVVLVLYPNWSVLLAPALIVSRQWAWLMAPFWAITITFGSGRLSFRKPLQASVASIAVVAGLVTLLYSSTSFEELWRAIFWFQGAVHSPAYSGDYGLTFSCDSPIFNRTLQNGDFKSRQREC